MYVYGEPMNIDLGCGYNKAEGYIGVDAAKKEGVDLVHELDEKPYPFNDNVADIIHASHILEHVGDVFCFFDECYRILKPGGILHIKVPHYSSRSAWQNPEHKRAFALGWFGELCDDIGVKKSYKLEILSKKLHYSNTNYRPGKGPRLHEKILDFIANRINQRWFERLCIFWVGGYEEIEVKLKKND